MDGRSRSELTQAMKKLTELENPNSVQQMKQWLADNGVETDTLGKKAVAEMLKTAPPQLQTVLSLRQQLAKSSVKKYQAMENAVCADGRARGCSSFTEPTVPGAGQAASFRCKISHRTIWKIWPKPEGLFGQVALTLWKCSMRMCRTHCPSSSAPHSCHRKTGNSSLLTSPQLKPG